MQIDFESWHMLQRLRFARLHSIYYNSTSNTFDAYEDIRQTAHVAPFRIHFAHQCTRIRARLRGKIAEYFAVNHRTVTRRC